MSLSYHSMMILEDGTVKGCGLNDYGQLGIGNTANQNSPVTVPVTGVKQICCGGNYTFFLLDDGTVKATGNNNYGQLGIGSTANQNSPVTVPVTGVKQISCGSLHTFFLLEDGTVKSCGRNNDGQLGIGSTANQNSPVTVPVTGVKQISCGREHTFFLFEDGTVKACGNNNYGQLGIGNTTNQYSPVTVPITGVKQISCGTIHTFFLLEDGTVKSTGRNDDGQLGIGNTADKNSPVTVRITGVKQISCGETHTFFLLDNRTVKGCGRNDYGQLGIGNTTVQNSPVTVPIRDIKQISCGANHTFFLFEDGTVKTTGYNVFGQLGIGSTTHQNSPVTVPVTGVKQIWDNVIEFIYKYLIQVGEDIKTYTENWTTIGQVPVTQTMFDESSIKDLSLLTKEQWNELKAISDSFTILVQAEDITDVDITYTSNSSVKRNLETTAIPHPQILLPTEDIIFDDINNLKVSVITSGEASIKIITSIDSGMTWSGKKIIDPSDLTVVKTNGYAPDELNSLTKEELQTLFPNKKARFAFYLEQEKLTDIAEINSLKINETIYIATPSISSIQVIYETLKASNPTFYASRNNGVDWTEIQIDELNNLEDTEEGQDLRVKAVLSDGQELHGISYSWL